MSQDRRSKSRPSTDIQVRCYQGPNAVAQAAVTDLTTPGCKIQVDSLHELEPGQTITLKFGNLLGLSATVTWVLDDAVGLAFEDPFHPSVGDHLVNAQTSKHGTAGTIRDKFGRILPKLNHHQRKARD